ncbi:hypothetical protein GN956_G17035 [Arapaima gigas]
MWHIGCCPADLHIWALEQGHRVEHVTPSLVGRRDVWRRNEVKRGEGRTSGQALQEVRRMEKPRKGLSGSSVIFAAKFGCNTAKQKTSMKKRTLNYLNAVSRRTRSRGQE